MPSSKIPHFLLIVICLAILLLNFSLSYAASSKRNRKIAEQNYPDSLFERFVATHLGDEFPRMRDDLIRRKNNGEGIVQRHVVAWTTISNWEMYNDDDYE